MLRSKRPERSHQANIPLKKKNNKHRRNEWTNERKHETTSENRIWWMFIYKMKLHDINEYFGSNRNTYALCVYVSSCVSLLRIFDWSCDRSFGIHTIRLLLLLLIFVVIGRVFFAHAIFFCCYIYFFRSSLRSFLLSNPVFVFQTHRSLDTTRNAKGCSKVKEKNRITMWYLLLF